MLDPGAPGSWQLSGEVDKNPEPGCVVVLGMHRSATSALTRMLGDLGLSLPRAADLGSGRSQNTANVRGFWEPRLLVIENERILNQAGGSWSAPPNQIELEESLLKQSTTVYQRLLVSYHRAEPVWVWKDPRLCLTLRRWVPLLGRVRVVFVFRHPLEVADSLHRRDGLDKDIGLALWERYVRSALSVAVGHPAIVIFHHVLLDDPGATSERLVRWLASEGVGIRGNIHEASSAVEPSLSRRLEVEDAELPELILDLWNSVRALPADSFAFSSSSSPFVSHQTEQVLEGRRVRVGVDYQNRAVSNSFNMGRAWAVELAKRGLNR